MHRSVLLAACALAALLPSACQSPSRMPSAVVAGTHSLAEAIEQARTTTTSNTGGDREACTTATQRAAILWLAQSGGSRKPVTVQGSGHTFTLSAAWPESLLFDELIVVPPLKGTDAADLVRKGVGAPLLARWRPLPERKAGHPLMPESGYLSPVTATLEFHGQNVALRLHDPRLEQTVTVNGGRQTLAADFTAMERWVKATMKSDKTLGISGFAALRNSGEYISKLGVFSLEPPSRDRIPVVFVHGLMSRPLTWQRVFSELFSEPEIARNYQFYFFRYPTGVPVGYSAARCREHLAILNRELVRVGNTVHRGRMVLVGHSMGGLVSKSQVQISGDKVWEAALGTKRENVTLSKAEEDALRPLVEFEPNADVSRVVFICTPHRGSKLATGGLGSLGRRLIKLPRTALGGVFSLIPSTLPLNSPLQELMASGGPSSIENLSPQSLYVKVGTSLPFKPGIHIHSIIGNKKGLPLDDPICSDGLVPYASAHLDGVDSELVVHSGHSAQERPETIAELRRILHLHLAGQ